MKKVFLKLDGINGEAPGARRDGVIEVSSFYWGSSLSSLPADGKRAGAKDLTIVKRTDNASEFFSAATTSGKRFHGQITLEDYSARGALVRAITFEMQSVAVASVTHLEAGELIALSCDSITLQTPLKATGKAGEKDKKAKIMKRNLVIISIFLVVLALCALNVAAQFTVKLPDIKITKPEHYYRLRPPVGETNTFYGNPLDGFAIQ